MEISKSEVAVVILNYNGANHLQTFLPSVLQHSSGAHIVVADNGSTDRSADVVSNFPEVTFLPLGSNYGFCGGYNQALAQIEASYYVLLNSDVEVTANWLLPLYQHIYTHPEVAAVQPKIKSYHEQHLFEYAGAGGGFIDALGYPFCRGRIFDTLEPDMHQYDDACAIFWATGACMMIRAELYHQIGGLDEDFFAHMEEIDLCWRLKRAGYAIHYVGSSTVYHVGGGTLHKTNPRKTFYNFRNSLLVLVKNQRQWIFSVFFRLLLDFVAGIRFLVLGELGNLTAIVKAHFSFYRLLPKMLHKRKAIPHKPRAFPETYPSLIVWDYFVKRRNQFSKLPFAHRITSLHKAENPQEA